MFTPERASEFKLNLSASPGQIINPRLIISSERKSARVLFELDPGGENAVELRLLLESGDKPVSETWLYRWTP